MTKNYEEGFADGTHRMMGCLAGNNGSEFLRGLLLAIDRSCERIRSELARVEAVEAEEAEAAAWAEYDAAADWCASQGFTGATGTPLPEGLGARAAELIDDDDDAFAVRVREHAYARAMERITAA